MAQQNSDELDIAQIVEKIKQGYHNLLIWIYNIFYFFMSKWVILLILIFVGGIAGYFLQSDKLPKETELLVQINFDGVNYVYDAIDQLENKILEKDTTALKEIGIYKNDTLAIKKVEIGPIVDVLEIVESDKGDERNLEVLIDQSKIEDDLLTSEIFIPKYKNHKIKLYCSSNSNANTISTFLDYLNNNPLMNEIKETVKKNVNKEIEHNEQSIDYIDSIAKAYATRPVGKAMASQIYFNNMDLNNGNLHLLFEQKNLIVEETNKLKVEVLKYDNIVQLMNKPMLYERKNFFTNKVVFYPVLLIFVFILFSIVRYFYQKARKLSREKKTITTK